MQKETKHFKNSPEVRAVLAKVRREQRAKKTSEKQRKNQL
jgi:hypothetical protein